MNTTTLALLGASVLGLSGCLGCTLIGCSDGVFLTFETAGGLPLGGYDLHVDDSDGLGATCSFTVVAEDCSGTCIEAIVCDDGAELFYEVDAGDAVASLGLIAALTGEDVTAVVIHDGTTVVDEALTLEYTELSPNGERCGPTCRTAAATVVATVATGV